MSDTMPTDTPRASLDASGRDVGRALRRALVCGLAFYTLAAVVDAQWFGSAAPDVRGTVWERVLNDETVRNPVWPAGPYLFAMLIAGTRLDRVFLGPSLLVAALLANVTEARVPLHALLYALCGLFVAAVASWIVLRAARRSPHPSDRPWWRFCGVGLVVALVLSTALGGFARGIEIANPGLGFVNWGASALFVSLVGVPLGLVLSASSVAWWRTTDVRRLALLVGFSVTTVVPVMMLLQYLQADTSRSGGFLVALISSTLLLAAHVCNLAATGAGDVTKESTDGGSDSLAYFLALLRSEEATQDSVVRLLSAEIGEGRTGLWTIDSTGTTFTCRTVVHGSTSSVRSGVPLPTAEVEADLRRLLDGGLVACAASDSASALAKRFSSSLLLAPLGSRGRITSLLIVTVPGERTEWSAHERAVVLAAAERMSSVLESKARRRLEEQRTAIEQAAGIYVWRWDGSARFTHASAGIQRVLGRDPREIVGRSVFELVPDDELPRFLAFVQEVASKGTRFESFEHRILGEGDRVVWLRVSGEPVRGTDGEFDGFEGVAVDVTPQRQAAERLRASLAEAEAASRAKDEFLANTSHEIRTPMTAILGYTDLLLDDRDEETPREQRREHLKTIQRQGRHLLGIVNDILDLARIESGKLEIEQLDVDLNHLVDDVVQLMEVRARERKLKLEAVAIGLIPATIRTDELRLRQILVNLIGNAIKFTEKGSVRVEVSCPNPRAPRPLLRFEVIDTGIGMTEEQLGRLFQRFSQADAGTTRRFGGTGLGLTISRRLAVMLGGDIRARSVNGEGSRFTATVATGLLDGVPMRKGIARTQQGTIRTRVPVGSAEGCRLLLVDDLPDNRMVIGSFLRRFGIEVSEAEDGRRAVDAVFRADEAEIPFDVVLLDMQMPVMDGYSCVRELRERGWTRPVIALTANAMDSEREKCLAAGCNDFATKPIDRDELLRSVVAQFHAARGRALPEGVLSGTFAKT